MEFDKRFNLFALWLKEEPRLVQIAVWLKGNRFSDIVKVG
jgi:hypothetical protein